MASRPELPPGRFCLAVIRNGAGEVLFLRRADGDSFAPGLWSVCGGRIRAGETPEAAMERELREELGGEISLRLLRRVDPVRDTLYGGVHEIHLFLYRHEGGAIRLNDEHQDHAWVAKETYRTYAVVDGVDEDLFHLGVWPVEFLHPGKLPGPG